MEHVVGMHAGGVVQGVSTEAAVQQGTASTCQTAVLPQHAGVRVGGVAGCVPAAQTLAGPRAHAAAVCVTQAANRVLGRAQGGAGGGGQQLGEVRCCRAGLLACRPNCPAQPQLQFCRGTCAQHTSGVALWRGCQHEDAESIHVSAAHPSVEQGGPGAPHGARVEVARGTLVTWHRAGSVSVTENGAGAAPARQRLGTWVACSTARSAAAHAACWQPTRAAVPSKRACGVDPRGRRGSCRRSRTPSCAGSWCPGRPAQSRIP